MKIKIMSDSTCDLSQKLKGSQTIEPEILKILREEGTTGCKYLEST